MKVVVTLAPDHPAALELISARVPMVRKTFPTSEPFRVTITKPDQFYRANGKVIPGNLARYCMR